MTQLGILLDTFNGVSVAYIMGLANSLLALLFAFGVHISNDQRSAIAAFLNVALVLTAHIAHAQAKRDHATVVVAEQRSTSAEAA